MSHMRVKICGITNVADALLAQEAGASAIGLIFAEGSRRQVNLKTAEGIIRATGPFLQRVGVFRNQPLQFVLDHTARLRLEAVQLHGSEDQAFVARVAETCTVIKAIGFRPDLSVPELDSWPADAILLDAQVPGAGRTFDWYQVAHLAGYPGLVLAGGLTPANVAEAIQVLRPHAVDVASGVETAGQKSPSLVRSFIAAAWGHDSVSTGPAAY